MKNVVLLIAIALLLLNGAASAQIMTENGKDSAKLLYTSGTDLTIVNGIRSGSPSNIVLRWSVIAGSTSFGPGWEVVNSGICDNHNCYTAINGTNNLFTNNATYQSDPYDNSPFPTSGSFSTPHDFHVIFTANNPGNGSSAVVRISAYDTVGKTSRTFTYIAYKSSTGVSTINSSDDIILYPNPAREAVNVVYDERAGVKTIAVYNLIGKLMGPVYKPSSNGSAKIDLEDMPTGIYFLRLMNGQGHVVATRRFTRQ